MWEHSSKYSKTSFKSRNISTEENDWKWHLLAKVNKETLFQERS